MKYKVGGRLLAVYKDWLPHKGGMIMDSDTNWYTFRWDDGVTNNYDKQTLDECFKFNDQFIIDEVLNKYLD